MKAIYINKEKEWPPRLDPSTKALHKKTVSMSRPFLKTGITLANLILSGTNPVRKDVLNINGKGSANSHLKIFRIAIGILEPL